jgi:hypothetical protein
MTRVADLCRGSLDFPPDIDIDPAIEYLESLQEASVADWRMNEFE